MTKKFLVLSSDLTQREVVLTDDDLKDWSSMANYYQPVLEKLKKPDLPEDSYKQVGPSSIYAIIEVPEDWKGYLYVA